MRITATQEIRAKNVYCGDWDESGIVAVYLPSNAAAVALRRMGWSRFGSADPWVSPNGEKYWETGEALQIAITGMAY